MCPSFYVAGWNSFRVLARGLCVLVSALWAGDGVACACAVPLKDEVERVPSVVWCATVVCFAPVDVV